jgi:exodeoxyribonuclease V alpha subunit
MMTNRNDRAFDQKTPTEGPFSHIDIQFARFMNRLSETHDAELFLAAALVSRATSEGHVCLDLSSVAGAPPEDTVWEGKALRCPNLTQWIQKLKSTSVIGGPGDYTPLILDEQFRLYLYRYWRYEQSLAEDLRARAAADTKTLNRSLLRDILSSLFPEPGDPDTHWHKVAGLLSAMKRFCVVSGGPGTGKSTLIGKILTLILAQTNGSHMRIALAAPTGKAAARLQDAIKGHKDPLCARITIKDSLLSEASTIHRLLGAIPGSPYFRHNRENPLPVDLVVIDEASMVDLALMSKLVQALPRDARLILLGDRDQLASVEAGAVLADICDSAHMPCFSPKFHKDFKEMTGYPLHLGVTNPNGPPLQDCVVQLKKNYRFGSRSGIGEVSRAVNQGDGDEALRLMREGGYDDIGWKTLPPSLSGKTFAEISRILYQVLRETIIKGYKPYLEARDPETCFRRFERFRLLCAPRRGPYGVLALNRLAEHVLGGEHLIQPEKEWYPGRPVLITRNDYHLRLFNGDIGIILPDPARNHALRAFFSSPAGDFRSILPARLPEHETAFALTVHKSQGSEFDRALLLLPDTYSPVLTRELLYTGITRARSGVEVWGSEGVFLAGIRQRTTRASGLHPALWGDESGG